MLNVVSAQEASVCIAENIQSVAQQQCVDLPSALGRVLAEDIVSKENIPPFDRSSVDGFALSATDTYGCSQDLPSVLTLRDDIQMGQYAATEITTGECARIRTGGMLPKGANACVMHEYCEEIGDGSVYVCKPVAFYENCILKGDDISQGQCLVKKGTVITSGIIGQMAALGISNPHVFRKLRVGILSTGDELVPYYDSPREGCIRDINSLLLQGIVAQHNADVKLYPIVRDNPTLLEEAVLDAISESDMVLISGGSSAGDKDASIGVLEKIGHVLFHGIAIKPGKPTIFATVDSKPVFSLPGHPLAAALVCHVFVIPALCSMMNAQYKQIELFARTHENIPSNHGREEIVPVSLYNVENSLFLKPLYSKSGVISVLQKADGYIRIARNCEGINKNTDVKVYLFSRPL